MYFPMHPAAPLRACSCQSAQLLRSTQATRGSWDARFCGRPPRLTAECFEGASATRRTTALPFVMAAVERGSGVLLHAPYHRFSSSPWLSRSAAISADSISGARGCNDGGGDGAADAVTGGAGGLAGTPSASRKTAPLLDAAGAGTGLLGRTGGNAPADADCKRVCRSVDGGAAASGRWAKPGICGEAGTAAGGPPPRTDSGMISTPRGAPYPEAFRMGFGCPRPPAA